jgi:hypothetical protein
MNELPLTKRNVYACCSLGRVEVLALDAFDTRPGNDLAVLGASGVALLEPATYAVKSQAAFELARCDGCVHMDPYLVPDGKGSFLIATSDGLSDSTGRLLWENKATGFSRVVPVRVSAGQFGFFSYQTQDRVDFRDIGGQILWTVKLPVNTVGTYGQSNGQQLPFAIVQQGGSQAVHVFGEDGSLQQSIPLPNWAYKVQSIDWPQPGHLLVGTRSWIGVLDANGNVVLKHVIENTSFNPYHGPEGVAVRFRDSEAPYLTVMSHGSSGYPRSVLLVFDPKGRLVWQEELNKLRTAVAVSRTDGKGEALLVGGMDGVLEYTLSNVSPR